MSEDNSHFDYENENEHNHDFHLLLICKDSIGNFVLGEYCTAKEVLLGPVIITGDPLKEFQIASYLHPFDEGNENQVIISSEDLITCIPLDIQKFSKLFETYKAYREHIEIPLPSDNDIDEDKPLLKKFH
jgi:hypothetical protein